MGIFVTSIAHSGLLEQKGEKIEVMAQNLDYFVQNMAMHVKLHYAATKPRGEVRQYHICLGKPIYSSPLKKVKAISTRFFLIEELVYPDLVHRSLPYLSIS